MISIGNDLLDGGLCKIVLFPHFLFFPAFNHDFIMYIDFPHIADSSTASDEGTN